jgi:protein phosphatase
MALKVKYPEKIHLLRGNHEDRSINEGGGFFMECWDRIHQTRDVFDRINDMFEWLPLAAVIEKRIICLHGGIGSVVKSITQLGAIKRPIKV